MFIILFLIQFNFCIASSELINALKKGEVESADKILIEYLEKNDIGFINKLKEEHEIIERGNAVLKGVETALSIAIGKHYNDIAKKIINVEGIILSYSKYKNVLHLNYLLV